MCTLMCNWTVNHGVIWTIAMDIALVGLLIERRLYVHELALMPRELVMPPSDGAGGGGGATARSTGTNERSCVEP